MTNSLTYGELESERDRLARELHEAQTELADRTAERDEAHALMVQARAERDRPKSPIGQVVITPAAQSTSCGALAGELLAAVRATGAGHCGHDLEAFERHDAEMAALRRTIADLAKTGDEALDELGRLGTDEGLRADNERLTAELDETRKRVAHYERCIDWDATCKACAAGLDISHELAMRAEQAEEERDRLAADNERLRARVHEAVDECQRRHAKYVSRCAEFEHWSAWARQRFEDQGSRYWSLMSEADRLVIMTIIAERDRLADAIRRYEPVIEAAKVWLLPKGNTVEIDNAHNALEDAIEALGDASEAHPNPYRAASVMPHYPRIAAERTVVEAAKAWRAARPGPWTSGADVEFGLLCAVDALGEAGADPDGVRKSAQLPAGADIYTGPDDA